MATDSQEWARRIRAAAAYAGLGSAELAGRLGMSDSTLRRHLAAKKRPHEQRALWQTVADITELPEAFFTVDFARLPELDGTVPVEPDDLLQAQIRAALTGPAGAELVAQAVAAIGPDRLRAIADAISDPRLADLTRQTKAALVDPKEADPPATRAAADTQSEGASTSEEGGSRPAATRRSGRPSGA